jgi:YVTN family beta-propeller protein
MSIINKTEGEKYGINQNQYYLTEFDLVNVTSAPIVYDLFNTTTLTNTPSQLSAPSSVGTGVPVVAPLFLAFCSNNNTVYIGTAGTNFVNVLDCNTNTIVATINVGNPQINQIAYNPINNFMYVVGQTNDEVVVINCSTNTVVGLPIGMGLLPFGIVYNPTNNFMYVSNQGSQDVNIIDCNTNLVVATIAMPLGFVPTDLTYNSNNNSVYILDNAPSSNIIILDCNTNTTTLTTNPSGTNQFTIEYCSVNNTIYVVNQGSNDVSVIDCSTNTLVSSVPVGTNPYDIIYDNISNSMFVTNTGSLDIYTINCSTNTVSNIVSTPSAPFGVTFNPTNNSIFTSNFFGNTITPITSLTTTFITGSFNYNDFVRDLLYNPVNVKQFMLYSNNIANINQVIYATTKDANGKAFYYPKFPALSLNVNQFQASVSKIDFGNRGFTLDANTSLSNFTIQGQSSIKLILVQQQLEKSKLLTKTDNFDLFRNKVKPINGNKFDNLVPLSKVSVKDFFYQIKNDM